MAAITDRIRKISNVDQILDPGPTDGRIWCLDDDSVWVNITGTPHELGSGGSGTGDVNGPGSATANAVPRFSGTGGKTIKNSGVVVDDSNNITGVAAITVNNAGLNLKAASNSNILRVIPSSTLTTTRVLSLATGDSDRTLTFTSDASIGGTNTGDQLVFKTISVSGQSDVVADTITDTLTLVAGSGMTITTNASTDTITFVSTGGGGGIPDDDSVSTVKIQNLAVTGAKIAAATVTSDKLAGPLPLLTADPGSPADDTWWGVRTGSSPTQVVAIKARIGGVTVTVASITQ
jgi:hypothetical protein